MGPQQRKFAKAARRCRGNVTCMSRSLSGYGILPATKPFGTKCSRYYTKGGKLRSGVGKAGAKRCSQFRFSREYEPYRAAKQGWPGAKTGSKYARGIWASLYGKKRRSVSTRTITGSCKSFQPIGSGASCRVRCKSFKHRGMSAAAAEAKCAGKAMRRAPRKSRKGARRASKKR